uniref:U2A'/phosphoprotein 32 family A C-terminal domain-containing protein n=1 Tax=Triatoma infestans TaxID=30076 RepID=A0A023F828_TRIIF
MVMLTEEMVIVRTKQSNLGAITKLNFWGSQLSDVSILRKMTNVVVLSLSVNNIDTLVDIQYCKRLQDLFVRKNNIKDLNEVCYLKDLHQLRSLWLEENPCSNNTDGYRLAVIKALPQLEKLDDIIIENSETVKAQTYGKTLYRPDQIGEYYSDSDEEEYEKNYIQAREERCPSPEAPPVEQQRNNYSPEPQIPYQRERDYVPNNTYENEQNVYNEVNRQEQPPAEPPEIPIRTYKYEEKPETQTNQRPPQFASIPRSRTTDGEFAYNNDWKRRSCQGSTCCVQSAQKRPNERRTNVLNAVLCLIKELDYPNLEVVQMAVNCRMEELSDEM